MEKIPMTKEGFQKLQDRLRHLTEEVLPKIQEAMGVAIQHGDVSDSGDYRAAREEIWRIDNEICGLQQKLSQATIVDYSTMAKDKVGIGSTVKLKDRKLGEIETLTLVGHGETDFRENKIAIDSPIGAALVGHKPGDVVEVQVPAGRLVYEIIEINW